MVILDREGRPAMLLESQGRGSALAPGRLDAARTGPCLLAVPPGRALLRRSLLPASAGADAEAAVRLEAQASLLADPDLGFAETLALDLGRNRAGVLAWLPGDLLDNAGMDRAGTIEDRMGGGGSPSEAPALGGLAPEGVLVPELCWADPAPTLLCARDGERTHVRYLFERVPLLWDTAFPGGPGAGDVLALLAARLRAEGLPAPARAVFWTAGDENPAAGLKDPCTALFPHAAPESVRGWAGLLERLARPASPGLAFWRAQGPPVFRTLARAWDAPPPTPRQWLRLASFAAAALCGLLLFLTLALRQEEREVADLEKEVARLKVLAARSQGAAERIEELNRKLKAVNAATSAKPSMLGLLRDIADCVPGMVALDSLDVTAEGLLSLTGRAGAEFALVTLVDNLNTSAQWQGARLVSMRKDPKSGELAFSIQATTPSWREHFQERRGP